MRLSPESPDNLFERDGRRRRQRYILEQWMQACVHGIDMSGFEFKDLGSKHADLLEGISGMQRSIHHCKPPSSAFGKRTARVASVNSFETPTLVIYFPSAPDASPASPSPPLAATTFCSSSSAACPPLWTAFLTASSLRSPSAPPHPFPPPPSASSSSQ